MTNIYLNEIGISIYRFNKTHNYFYYKLKNLLQNV